MSERGNWCSTQADLIDCQIGKAVRNGEEPMPVGFFLAAWLRDVADELRTAEPDA